LNGDEKIDDRLYFMTTFDKIIQAAFIWKTSKQNFDHKSWI